MDDNGLLTRIADAELAAVGRLEMNLAVAKGVPSLACLDVSHYGRQADEWAGEIQSRLPGWERAFHKTPETGAATSTCSGWG